MKNQEDNLEQAHMVAVIEKFQEFDIVELADFMDSTKMTNSEIDKALAQGCNSDLVNAVENFLALEVFIQNEAPQLEGDFIMIAGYSEEDAMEAAQNVLDYDEK